MPFYNFVQLRYRLAKNQNLSLESKPTLGISKYRMETFNQNNELVYSASLRCGHRGGFNIRKSYLLTIATTRS